MKTLQSLILTRSLAGRRNCLKEETHITFELTFTKPKTCHHATNQELLTLMFKFGPPMNKTAERLLLSRRTTHYTMKRRISTSSSAPLMTHHQSSSMFLTQMILQYSPLVPIMMTILVEPLSFCTKLMIWPKTITLQSLSGIQSNTP